MKNLEITSEAAQFLRAMIVSCGNIDCFDSIKKLGAVTSQTDFLSIAQKPDGCWRMKAFERLYNFAKQKNARQINLDLVAWYFGSHEHIEIMYRYGGHAGLGEYLGADAGLITHTLLPLDEKNFYQNGENKLYLEKFVDLGGVGSRFYHLGAVLRAEVSQNIIETIKAEQIGNKHFRAALLKINKKITIPSEYFEAINCTIQKVA